jgi:PAS domain S-box-containing protein
MESLAPLLMTSIVVCLLMGVVLLYLRGRNGSEYLTYWGASFFLVGFQHSFAIWAAFQSPNPIYGALLNLITLIAGGCVLVGTYLLLNRRIPKMWFVPAALIAIWTLVSPFWGVGFLAATAPAFWFRGLTDIFAGTIILCQRREGAGRKIAAWGLILWGTHQLDYPILRNVEWIAPWGFAVGMVFGFIVGVGLLMAHYEIARRELATSEDEFRSLFEHSFDGIFRANEDGKLLRVNPALEIMLGYETGRLEGLCCHDLTANHAADAVNPNDGEGVEQIWKRADGRHVHVILRTRESSSTNGKIVEGSVRDITQTRMLQEQLNLARRMDSLGRLAGGIAHDFNNILTAILGSVDLLEMELDAKRSPTRTLEMMRMSTLKAAELSSQLLAFTRQRSGEAKPELVKTALENTESMLRRLLPDSVSLLVQNDAPEVCCLAEPGQLARVVLNLAINAQDAMPDGGVIEINLRRRDSKRVLLEVCDTGVGIDADILQQIFEPFFSTKGTGTGLGLANVFMLVESMGGEVSVESAIGEGSKFRVTLPIAQPPENVEIAASQNHARTEISGPRILLVEDRELVRKSIRATLEHAGYEVVCAANGKEGLKVMRDQGDQIDVVLTDVLMPVMSGPALIDELLVLRPNLNFLMMSGHSDDELEHFGLLDRHFVAKPFSTAQLLEKLKAVRES